VIDSPTPPNIPLAPTEWDSRFHDQYSNVFRLYFNRLSAALQNVFGVRGGQFLSYPYGAYQNDSDVTQAAINTPSVIPLTTTDFESGVYYIPGDGIHVEQSGLYNLQYSLQFRNTDSQLHNAYVWLRKNGIDAPGTASAFTVASKHGAIDGYSIGSVNFYMQLMAQEYVELWWAVDSTAVSLDMIPAQTTPYPRPVSPSAVVTLTFVSAV
jgi:hypothetical protein